MRRFILILALLLGAAVAAALIAPSLIPADAWRARLESAASNALGRQVTVDGEISLSILPRVQALAGDVTIANAEGFGDQAFAEMEQMRLSLQFWPLLQREFIIEEFILVDPVIRLEDRGGRNNWTFASGEPAPAQAQGEGFRRPGSLPLDASFGDVRIENGMLVYTSGGQSRTFENVDLAVDLPGVDQPVSLDGRFALEGQTLDFAATLGSLRAFFEGARTPASLFLTGPSGEFDFDGHVLESSELEYEGAADLDLALPQLAALFGSSLPEGETFRRFAATGQLAGAPGRASLSEAALTLDDTRAAGSLTLDYAGARPNLDARVSIAELDLNPYLPQAETGRSGTIGPWSEDRIDLSALNLMNARVRGSVNRLLVRDIEVSGAELDATLQNGRLSAVFPSFGLYGGRGNAALVANSRGAVPSYSFTGRLDTLQAQPFLQAAAGFERLRGLGTLSLDVDGSGNSAAAIMNSLSGQGGFDFTEGAIVGVNLAQLIRGVLTAIETRQMPDAFGEQQETDFSALRGTISIANGVAQNQDLTMLSPLLRVGGQGMVDLGAQRLDYRLTPRAVANLTGQGGAADLQGIAVPILISGSFSNPGVSLDFGTIARNLVQARAQGQLGDLGQLLDLDRVREQGAGGLLDILTGAGAAQTTPPAQPADPQASEGETQAEEPRSDEERVRDLFRGILGAATQPDEEEEAGEGDPGGG